MVSATTVSVVALSFTEVLSFIIWVIRLKKRVYKKELFSLTRSFCTLGLIIPPDYPDEDDLVKRKIEKPHARIDGKKVCNVLREQRLRIARENGIPFESENCPSIGPCAGTCAKCDREAEYLRKQMMSIPVEKRIYPQFNPAREVST